MRNQAEIAKRLISDDYMTGLIAPNEETRALLDEAITKFGEKYWTNRSGARRDRGTYASPIDVELMEFVEERLAARK